MDNIVDLIVNGSSPSKISDAIKDAIFAKSAERINSLRPSIADSIFDQEIQLEDEE